MKVLITGVSGFVGRKLAAQLLEDGHSVVGIGTRLEGLSFSKHPSFYSAKVDLTDLDAVAQLPWDGVELLYHLAAEGVKAPTRQWPSCISVNVIGTAFLIQALLKRVNAGMSVPRIVYTKTYYEDHLQAVPSFRENPYVLSKVAATRWLEAVASVYSESITIAKVYQVYGSGDDPNNVLSYAARQLKAGKVAEFGSGKSLRDWIYIDDFINGLVICAEEKRKGLKQFDLGTGERHSIREMVEKLAEITKAPKELLIFNPNKDRGDTEIEDRAVNHPAGWHCRFDTFSGLRNLVNYS